MKNSKNKKKLARAQPYDLKDQIKKLLELNKKNKLNVFVGAGVSVSCGLPDWAKLLDRLRSEIQMYRLEISDEVDLANQARDAFGDKFNQVVASSLYQDGVQISETALAVSKLGVKNIICFNFDDILEEVYKLEMIPHNVVLNGEKFNQNREHTTIFHPHGYLGRFDSDDELCKSPIVLSHSDYENLYRDHYCLTNLIQLSMLLTKSNLFIGMSMTDPNIERLLKKAREVGVSHRHYSLMKRQSEEFVKSETQRLRDLGVDPVWFQDYSDLPQILSSISKSKK
ncbi:SIR2 family protein [Shewanella khirikhana]|uniref:SIR2 family protein n=1 Tax=Shewanella khirikhana TaxID=1965282 RepID=UPI0030D3A21B